MEGAYSPPMLVNALYLGCMSGVSLS